MPLGYCTNVHAGSTAEEMVDQLQRHAVGVLDQLKWPALGVGLWIPATAAAELAEGARSRALGNWLSDRRLVPYTINGFPFGNFHQAVVKHGVYEPTWWDDARRDYTMLLVRILDQLLEPAAFGSISTLPIAWRHAADGAPPTEAQRGRAAANLLAVGDHLRRLHETTGRWITLAIEPEPGCVLDRNENVLPFFDRYIPMEMRPYISLCHDVCHAAVMGQSQQETIGAYRDAGIFIGKVQVSSAIEVHWPSDRDARTIVADQLSAFAEDRYLHQTMRWTSAGESFFVDDLPLALQQSVDGGEDALWRIHFHVPIHLSQFGALRGTQADILQCLSALSDLPRSSFSGHIEAETYAWTVLPEAMRPPRLIDGIAQELKWLHDQQPFP
jgi:hypothetical protein